MGNTRFSLRTLLIIVGLSATLIYGLCAASIGKPAIVRDAFAYNMTAQRLVSSGVLDYSNSTVINKAHPNAFILPGYILFLSPFYIAGGTNGSAVQNAAVVQGAIILVQLLLAVSASLITAYAAYQWKGLRSAAVAGALAVCYLPFGLNASITLTETVNLFLISLVIFAALALCDKNTPPKRSMFVLLALSGAASIYVRPVIALWVVVALGFCLLTHKDLFKDYLKYVVIALCVLALCMTPWIVRNAVSLHQFVALSTDPNPLLDSVGGSASLTAEEQQLWDASLGRGDVPQKVIARKRINDALRTDALGFVGNRAFQSAKAFTIPTFLPGDLLAELQFTDYSKAPNNALIVKSQTFMPESKSGLYNFMWYWSRFLHWALISLSIAAIALGFRSKRVWLLASFIMYYLAVHAAILVQVRYFYPTVLALILLSAYAINHLWERFAPAKTPAPRKASKKKAKK